MLYNYYVIQFYYIYNYYVIQLWYIMIDPLIYNIDDRKRSLAIPPINKVRVFWGSLTYILK